MQKVATANAVITVTRRAAGSTAFSVTLQGYTRDSVKLNAMLGSSINSETSEGRKSGRKNSGLARFHRKRIMSLKGTNPKMHETSLSLLERLRHSPDNECWKRLADLYTPLIQVWLRRYDVQQSDANDLVQEVLVAVSQDLGRFEHRGQPGAFRGWLKTILVNRLRKFWRARDRRPQPRGDSDLDARLAQLDDPSSELSRIWNREHDQYVLRQLLALAEPHFAPNTWTAFCQVALDGAKPEQVAEELKMSLNAVCLAKSRVLRRLRQESEGLIDSSSEFSAKS